MKKYFRILTSLIIFLALTAVSCKNSFLSKQTEQGGSICIVLPGSGRAADSDQTFNFEISFRNTDTKAEKILKGKTGEKIIYDNAKPGEYEIIAQVFDTSGKLCYEAKEKAIVKAGATTPVTLELLRFLRLWTINDDYSNYIKRYFDEHQDDGIFLEITKYDNAEEYYAQLDKALKINALDAPDIFSVEDPVLLRYTQGDMQDYTLPFDSLGITQTQIDAAQFYDYILQMATGTDNKIHGLGYQSTAGAMIYNKTIAEELDNSGMFGNYTSLDEALEHHFANTGEITPWGMLGNFSEQINRNLNRDDIVLTSGYKDLWLMYRAASIESNIDQNPGTEDTLSPWINNEGSLVLDYFVRDFYEKVVNDKFYTHNTDQWTPEWNQDMNSDNVFAFFAPAWFINYCLQENCDDNNRWGICQAPIPFTWGGSFLMVNKNLPELKKGVTKRLIEWMMLDTSTDGLMYKVASEEKDTVTSRVVMNKIIEEGKGTSAPLGGANIFTIYDTAAQSINIEYKTPYDTTLNDMFIQEINDYKNFGLPREGTLMRFELNVFRRFGFRGDDIHDEEFTLNDRNSNLPNSLFNGLTVKPCNEGIQFIISFNGNPKEQLGGNCISTFYIRNAEDGIAMFIEDLLDAKNFGNASDDNPIEVTCIYPANIEKDDYYSFDFNFMIFGQEPEYDEEYCIPFIAKAGGGNQYVTYKDYGEARPTMDNFDISFPEKHTFDVKPANSYFSCFTFSNEVTEKKMDCMIYGKYNREGFEEETVLYSYDCDHCGDFTQGTVISINDSGWPFIFTNYFDTYNYSDSFEKDGKHFWQFSADLTVNFWIEGFIGCRFRMPPVRSDNYLYMVSNNHTHTIISPDGEQLAEHIEA